MVVPHKLPFWLVGMKTAGKPFLTEAVNAPLLSVVYVEHDTTSSSSVALLKPVLVIAIPAVDALDPRLVIMLIMGSFRITRLLSS